MEEDTEYKSILHSIETGEFSVSSFQATLFDLLKRGLLKNQGDREHLKRKVKYMILALLQAETDCTTQNSRSSTPEQMDIINTHKHIVHLLVNTAENCDFYDDRKRTVLHYASDYGWLEVVLSLLKKGADPNVKDVDYTTPLMLATKCLHKIVVNLLIESGADVLCRKIDDSTMLHEASEAGWLEFVQFLLNKGVDPNAANHIGFTPLHYAVNKSHRYVADLLIESGANVNSATFDGRSVLHLAVERSCLEVVECLVRKGADVNDKHFRDYWGNYLSPFFLACKYKKIDIIEYLVNAINLKNGSNDTPLNYIIRKSPRLELVKIFIERGAYLNFIDYYRILRNPSLKMDILQNIQICTQAIINKFNDKDLPDLYKLPLSVKTFPSIKNLMMKSRGIIQAIEQSVRSEIETKGYCNLMKPKVLGMMSVKSYIDYYDSLRKKTQLKRSATGRVAIRSVRRVPLPRGPRFFVGGS